MTEKVKSKKVKKGIAVCSQVCHHRYGNSHAIWDHTSHSITGGDIAAFTPAEAGTRFSDPEGMQGWVDLGSWLEMVYPHNGHPSWTNRARCWLTSLMRPTTLTTTPSRHEVKWLRRLFVIQLHHQYQIHFTVIMMYRWATWHWVDIVW